MPAPAGAMRVPQYPQKGRPLSAFLLHRGHRVGTAVARGGDALFGVSAAGGTAARAAVADCPLEPPDPASPPATAAPLLAPTWAAEAVIGLPQSMQNREVASFSRPQNEQAVNRHSPRGKASWRANIGERVRGEKGIGWGHRLEERAEKGSPFSARPFLSALSASSDLHRARPSP
jgi:hypothetical protein